MKNQSPSIVISLLLGTISYAEAVKVQQRHLWTTSGLKYMDNEQFQEDSPAGYANAVKWTSSPMTDKQLDDHEVHVNLDEATKLAKESAHKLVQTSKPTKQEGVRMLAELQDWDHDDVEYMGHESYVKKTPKNYKDLVSFEKVNMTDMQRKDYDQEKVAADAEKWAKRSEHHKYLGSLAQKKTYPTEDSHSYISPYNQRDHAFSFDQHDHQNEDQWETETSKRVPGWQPDPDKTLEQLKAEAAAEAKREAALAKAAEGVAPPALAQMTKKHKKHKKHHRHSQRRSAQETYPQPDSHSYLKPWTQRDHAWSNDQHDHTHDSSYKEQTEKMVPGWKADTAQSLEQLQKEAAAAKAKADTDAKTAADSENKAKALAQQVARAQSLAQNKYFRVETESYITPWTQRDHAWSLDQFEKENEDDYVAETKVVAPGIDFGLAQRSSMEPASLAEAAEALGMRVQIADDAVDKSGNPTTGDGEAAKGDRSKLKTYNQLDHAWTGDQYDMSNEKTWRKATWDITGYKSDRFFQPGKSTPKQSAAQGDKFTDTLLQSDSQIAPQSAAQKFRVETKSEIRPYVVRDHAWSVAQHDEMNAAEYQSDAPDGYTERMDYQPEPYNKPLDKSESATSNVQESVPGDKKVVVVQHPEHKEAAKTLKKEMKAEAKAKKQQKKEAKKEVEKAVKQETKKEVAKAEVKKEEKKVVPKTETPQAPKLAEKKSASGDAKKVPADKYDKVDPNSKLAGMHISQEVKDKAKEMERKAANAKDANKYDAADKANEHDSANKYDKVGDKKGDKASDKKGSKDSNKGAKSDGKESSKDSKSASKKGDGKSVASESASDKSQSKDSKQASKQNMKQAVADAKPGAPHASDVKKEGDRIDNVMAQKKTGPKTKAPVKEKAVAKEAAKETKKDASKAPEPKTAAPPAAPKKTETKTLAKNPEPAKAPKAKEAKPAAPAPAPAKSAEKKAPASKAAEPAKAAPSAPKAPEAAIKK